MNTELLLLLAIQIELAAVVIVLLLQKSKRVFYTKKNPVYVDTSVLIDGRIIEIAKSGFIPRPLIIPRSVLDELQLLADGADSDKRMKARSGLDVAKQLKDIMGASTRVLNDVKREKYVDSQLIALAKKNDGMICTIDFNLNKLAAAESITVLNVNELAKNIRMQYVPGEKVSLLITQKGNESHQGVGHLADGSMVVVENGQKDINTTIQVEFIRSLQTDAGKMYFARKHGSTKDDQPKRSTRKVKPNGKKRVEDSMVALANEDNS